MYSNHVEYLKKLEEAINGLENFGEYVDYPQSRAPDYVRDNYMFFQNCCSPNQLSRLIEVIKEGPSPSFKSKLRGLLRCTPTAVNNVLVYGASKYLGLFNNRGYSICKTPYGTGLVEAPYSDISKLSQFDAINNFVVSLHAFTAAYKYFPATPSMLCTDTGYLEFNYFLKSSFEHKGLGTDLYRVEDIFDCCHDEIYSFKPSVPDNRCFNVQLINSNEQAFALLSFEEGRISLTLHDIANKQYFIREFIMPDKVTQWLSDIVDMDLKISLYFLMVEFILTSLGIRLTRNAISDVTPNSIFSTHLEYPILAEAKGVKEIYSYVEDFVYNQFLEPHTNF